MRWIARKGEGSGKKQYWLTGPPRVQPSIAGAKMRAGRRTKNETGDEILSPFQ